MIRPALCLVLPCFLSVAACAADTGDDGGDQSSDALSNKTIQISQDLPGGLDKEFDKAFTHSFQKDGITIGTTLNTKTHVTFSAAKIAGDVTISRPLLQVPQILTANLSATAKYGATVEADVDITGNGTTDLLNKYASDWQQTPLGGTPLTLAQNLAPLDIPINGGPLFIHTHIDVAATCALTEIQGEAQVDSSAAVTGDVGVTVQFDRSKGLPANPTLPDPRFKFGTNPPDFQITKTAPHITQLTGHAKLRCSVQPTLVVLLEATIGAKIIIEPYVEVDAQMNGVPGVLSTQVGTGVDGFVQTDVEVLGRPLFKPIQFPLFAKEL